MRRISKLRFDSLAGYSRSPTMPLVAEELDWFEEAGEKVLGVLVRDLPDNDYACYVLGRDAKLRFRAVWIELFRHPRRSCEALAMATLQNDPWTDNPFPKFKSLPQLHAWIAPLVAEENRGNFSGRQCLRPEDFDHREPQKKRGPRTDWVLGWLKTMCKGEPIPPFWVELVLKDGARYNLHSVVAFED